MVRMPLEPLFAVRISHVCPSCSIQIFRLGLRPKLRRRQQQSLSTKVLSKKAPQIPDDEQAESRNWRKETVVSLLEERGLVTHVDQIVKAREDLKCLLTDKRRGIHRPQFLRIPEEPKTSLGPVRFRVDPEQAQQQWDSQAASIRSGQKKSTLSILEERGLINQIVGSRDDLDRLLTEKRVGIYLGIDPTASALHVGHLVPMMALYWMWYLGYNTETLVGGATCKIGDPSGRTTARATQDDLEQSDNANAISHKLHGMWTVADNNMLDFGFERHVARQRTVINNKRWLNKVSVVEFLSILGPGVRLGPMLGRDTVKTRLQGGNGMTIAEFLYPLVQAWDWWHMYSERNVQVQIGGADQFGNILAGMDAINHIRKLRESAQDDDGAGADAVKKAEELFKKPMGFTVPLLTTASGEKFGKSAGNAIWLDQRKTSAFNLYKYFLSTADADVHRYLKLFTFEPMEALDEVMEKHNKDWRKRVAQHKLAFSVVRTVYGKRVAEAAEAEHSLFYGVRWGYEPRSVQAIESYKVSEQTSSDVRENVVIALPRSMIDGRHIKQVLYSAGMVTSLTNAQSLLAEKGVYVGIKPNTTYVVDNNIYFSSDFDKSNVSQYLVNNNLLFLRTGKANLRIVKVISDEEFRTKGFDAPGWSSARHNVST